MEILANAGQERKERAALFPAAGNRLNIDDQLYSKEK